MEMDCGGLWRKFTVCIPEGLKYKHCLMCEGYARVATFGGGEMEGSKQTNSGDGRLRVFRDSVLWLMADFALLGH